VFQTDTDRQTDRQTTHTRSRTINSVSENHLAAYKLLLSAHKITSYDENE